MYRTNVGFLFCFVFWVFYAPGSKDRGHIVFVLFVCFFFVLFFVFVLGGARAIQRDRETNSK